MNRDDNKKKWSFNNVFSFPQTFQQQPQQQVFGAVPQQQQGFGVDAQPPQQFVMHPAGQQQQQQQQQQGFPAAGTNWFA